MRNIFINQHRRKVKSKTIFDNSKEGYLLNQSSAGTPSPSNLLIAKEIKAEISNLGEEYNIPFEMHIWVSNTKRLPKN